MQRVRGVIYSLMVVGLGGCGAEPSRGTAALAAPSTLAWGSGPSQLGLRTHAEAQTQGPAAIAVDATGRALVLDRLNERVLRVAGARVETVASAAEDTELLAVGGDGTLALYSGLRSKVELVAADGHALGSIEVPRALGPVRAIALGASHRVTITTALQDRYELGSPSFPLPLPVVQATRKEGALALPEGRNVVNASIVVKKGQATLLLSAQGERAVVRELVLPGRADAAQLIGSDGAVACARVETLRPAEAIEVDRRAVCIDTTTGGVRLDQALPAPGLYAPRVELAVGHGEVQHMMPGPDGLALTRYAFGGGAQ